VVSLVGSATGPEAHSSVIRYLNRLADLLFVLPRVVNARAAIGDENWRKDRPDDRPRT
jgi:cob(I)alamin adenosyltransferase